MDDKLLIELVRERTELYNLYDSRYCDNSHKSKLWREIGRKLHQDVGKCKQRWESLRSQFRKHVRTQKSKYTVPGFAAKKWRYEKNLQFLLPYMKERTRNSYQIDFQMGEQFNDFDLRNSEDTEEVVDLSEDSTEAIPQVKQEPQTDAEELPSVKEHEVERAPQCQADESILPTESRSNGLVPQVLRVQSLENVPDEYDLFFDAMKMTIKKFSTADKLLVKRKIFNVVADIEEKYIGGQYQQMYPSETQCGQNLTPTQLSQFNSSHNCESRPCSADSVRLGNDMITDA